MHTIELTDAVRSYLDDFGHDEQDIVRRITALLEKLPDE